MAEETRLRLGRGLAALIGEASEEPGGLDRDRSTRRAPIEFIRPNPRNPRKQFDDAKLDELADSIRERGILQPIVVRAVSGGANAFEIVAGERRWRAAQKAHLHTVPIVVIEATEKESLELAIIENVQRSDLNALEEAEGYAQLVREYQYSQNDLAKIIGKSRSHIANTLRLLNLPDSVKNHITSGALSAGHARALLSLERPEPVAQRIIAQGLSVRDVERIVQDSHGQELPKYEIKSIGVEKPADTKILEKKLQDATGLKVDIEHRGEGGTIRIRYKSLEQLEEICKLLGKGKA